MIGVVLIPVGLLIRGARAYFLGMMAVFGVVAATTLAVGVAALAYACATIDPQTVGEFTRYGNEISDDAAFARAGTMHNFSYLGGLLGILTGIVAILRQRRQGAGGETPKDVAV